MDVPGNGLHQYPEVMPLTTGHWDFKPIWSKTGNLLVFVRRLKNDSDVGKWITAACIINVDGTDFHQLADGTYTDFNPMWTRDGKNTPLWNRKTSASDGYCIMASKVSGKNQLYAYRLEAGSTRRMSTNARADYRYPHGEAAPC